MKALQCFLSISGSPAPGRCANWNRLGRRGGLCRRKYFNEDGGCLTCYLLLLRASWLGSSGITARIAWPGLWLRSLGAQQSSGRAALSWDRDWDMGWDRLCPPSSLGSRRTEAVASVPGISQDQGAAEMLGWTPGPSPQQLLLLFPADARSAPGGAGGAARGWDRSGSCHGVGWGTRRLHSTELSSFCHFPALQAQREASPEGTPSQHCASVSRRSEADSTTFHVLLPNPCLR